ncbi:MAG: endonuclease [Bacteroidota bacterium]
MKKYLLILLVAHFSFGQIPAGYYTTATGTGYTLKTQLFNIIDNHTDLGYAGLWVTYETSDRDVFTGTGYENDNSIYDMYTENPTGSIGECNFIYATSQDTGSGGGSECQFYNREHIVPQSIFAQASPMRNDAHFVPPSDKKVNGDRGDNPHGIVATVSSTTNNGGKHGSSAISGYSGQVFEPNPAFKGDIARMYFYFATRYEDTVASYTYEMLNGTSNQVFTTPFLNMLLSWHINDPVSPFEIARNNAIYLRQNNRNPYIDHPEYLCQIYSSQCAALSAESFLADSAVSIYPNPTNTNEVEVFTTEIITKLSLVNINGQIIKDIENPIFNQNSYKLSNLPQGFYFLQISAENGSLTKKIIVN